MATVTTPEQVPYREPPRDALLGSELAHTIEALRRPALAPGVSLVGRLEGSGYASPQWLVERRGKFIQISELLYRIAERADGNRTLDEIAAEVTAVSEWSLSADDVQHLLHCKLVPLGVVAPPEAASAPPNRSKTPSSPLALNIRARVIGPRLIRPIADVLKFLYEPPILIPVVVAALFLHGWLYVEHGIGPAAADAVLHPVHLLIVIGLVVLASAFHEFGHAAALRYGGGEVRGMGAGVYLIYPILYTDVTDGYRLGRWARVRTDLGGIYFHLLFAFGLIAVAMIAHQPFLLLGVILINLEMARQFIPFVRLDGYWLVADLTGIPDLFSQVGPFLARRVPALRRRWAPGPELRPRVRAIFGAYVALTIPALTALTAILLTRLPSLVETAWFGFSRQGRALPELLAAHQVAAAALSIAELVILGVPFVGLAYVAYYVGRLAVTAASRIFRPARSRGPLRVAGTT